jgi:hypothetical protein
MYRMHGQYEIEPPMAYRTPWVRMRCVVFWEKELKARAMHMMKRPITGDQRLYWGKSLWMPMTKGMPRYMIPWGC